MKNGETGRSGVGTSQVAEIFKDSGMTGDHYLYFSDGYYGSEPVLRAPESIVHVGKRRDSGSVTTVFPAGEQADTRKAAPQPQAATRTNRG